MTTQTTKKNAARRARRQAEPVDGHALFADLVGQIRKDKVGTVKKHPEGTYARVLDGKRTIGYVVPRRDEVRVYVNTLAKAVPDGVSFEKMKLGAHHFGRGEVVVAVAEPGDFKDAERALRAAQAHPVPRKGAK